MDMSLGKPREMVKDREGWRFSPMSAGHDRVTEQPHWLREERQHTPGPSRNPWHLHSHLARCTFSVGFLYQFSLCCNLGEQCDSDSDIPAVPWDSVADRCAADYNIHTNDLGSK